MSLFSRLLILLGLRPGFKYGLGWIPDAKDPRDYTLRSPRVSQLPRVEIAPAVDLRRYDSEIADQGRLGSCTSNAGCGLLQFLQKATSGSYVPLSRLYMYKATRYLMGVATGDTGASLRNTMQAIVMCGAPPEMYWNYDTSKYDEDPTWLNRPSSSWFLSSLAEDYEGTRYIRLDPDGASKEKVLADIKLCVNSKMPVIFGTLVWQGIEYVNSQGDIPMPSQGEQPVGGHALMIVGYDDQRGCLGTSSKGAFLIRNSWGTNWGDRGYGYLPYEYLMKGYAQDFWILQSAKFVNTGDFA